MVKDDNVSTIDSKTRMDKELKSDGKVTKSLFYRMGENRNF